MQFHAATKILLWVLLAAFIQQMPVLVLLLFSILLVLQALYYKARNFLLLLRRTRWLMISLLLIYGFASPGDPVQPLLGVFSPSVQGIQAGVMQVWRLLMLLAGLSILSVTTTQEGLLTGLYVIMRPFNRLGMNAERIVLRVWLTLNYAKHMSQIPKPLNWNSLSDTLAIIPNGANEVQFEVTAFEAKDWLLLLLGVVSGGLLLL